MPGVAPFPSVNQNKPAVAVADVPQPTPTGGLLPCIERANLGTPYSGGGGGGGGSTTSTFTNLFADNGQFSTLGVSSFTAYGGFSTNVISIPPGGQINLDQANLNLLYEDSTNNAAAIFIQWPGNLGDVPYASIQYYDEQTSTIRFQSYDYVKGEPTDDPATAIFSQEIRCSSLVVSSINNAAPGGGGGPNPVVSTLSVNDTGNITLDWNNGGGTLNFGFEATNTSSFQLQQGIGVSGTKVAGPEGCIQVLEKDGGANQVFAPLQASGFEVCATAYPGGAFAGLYFSSIGSILYSAVGQPLTIDAPAGVNMSSLSVSSINGAVPGGGNIYPLNSTLKSGEATGLGINASSLTTLAAYSTISSHFYTISVDLGPRQLTQTFGSGDGFQTQLTTENGLVNILNDGLWSQVSTLNNLAITPALGGSATFKADGSFFTIDIYNNYASTLSTNLNAIFAVDHGPGN